MALIQKLNDIKSQTDALLTYANETTGAGDTRLGDAVKTLADGFGSGGGGKGMPNAILVDHYNEDYILGDLFDPSKITPTTAAQTIIPAESARNFTLSEKVYLNEYALVIVWFGRTEIEYNGGTIHYPRAKGKTATGVTFAISRNKVIPEAAAYGETFTLSSYRYFAERTADEIGEYTTGYGVYDAGKNFSAYISSNQINNAQMRVEQLNSLQRPAISVRLNATNMSAESWADIDWNRSKYKYDAYIYKVPYEDVKNNPNFFTMATTSNLYFDVTKVDDLIHGK